MTSRRLIRIKVLQLLYAFSKKENATLVDIEHDLLQSMSKSTDLYYETLLLITELRHKAFLKIDAARNRRFASNIDLNPNTRFIENPVFDILEKNKKFQYYINNNLISWNNSQETIVYFYNKLLEWPAYQKYMHQKEVTFDMHKQLVLDLFTELIVQDDLFYQILEEKEQGDGAVRSLVEIHLHTGRHHQIRVQFAAHGTPLVGDTKYGAPAAASVGRARREPLALCAVRLSFLHPVTGERMEFSTEPQFTL